VKVLTAAEMREVDRRTMELGIRGAVLMENAGHRVVEFLTERFAPLSEQRVVIVCGKGNNGGDGLVIARQLFTRFHPASLHVVVSDSADSSEPMRMLRATGFDAISGEIRPEMRLASLVIDAVLGTGLNGAARGRALELIREINTGFPLARVVAVDIPSGMPSDGDPAAGEVARADATVTFTAPKVAHVLYDSIGELRVGHIGSAASLYENVQLHVTEPADFRSLLAPRAPESNKGTYGHVLIIGGNTGKAGAAEMAGLAALRSGAGLVTVACAEQRLAIPELMTTSLPHDSAALGEVASRKDVIAIGPGLGTEAESRELVARLLEICPQPVVIDADALNVLAGSKWHSRDRLRIVTPHPGEMSRLTGQTVAQVQADRIGGARAYAAEYGATVVLKGNRTIIAFPDGGAWVNPTGTPAMATGGTGDVLAGMIAGLIGQYVADPRGAVLAAVYLHGLAGEIGARELGDKCLIATDLLRYLPEAMRAAAARL
jgi:ADP-dependent NAD(P)H-hydrate dehydratase / NAD(P)H-hydrate epimerase